MLTNVLGVRCTPLVKGLGAPDTTADICVPLLLPMYVLCGAVAAATSISSPEVENKYTAEGT